MRWGKRLRIEVMRKTERWKARKRVPNLASFMSLMESHFSPILSLMTPDSLSLVLVFQIRLSVVCVEAWGSIHLEDLNMSRLTRSPLSEEESMGKTFHFGTCKEQPETALQVFPQPQGTVPEPALDTWPSSEKLCLERRIAPAG